MERITPRFKNAAKICAEHIIRQFPKLTILGVMTDDPFAMLVTEVINRLIGHKFERSCSDALLERSRSDALLASLGIYDLLDQFEIDGFLDEDSFEGDDHEFDYDPQPENMERRLEMEERLLLDADDSAGDMMELGLELDHDDDDENPAG